jgi:hypothetical protein
MFVNRNFFDPTVFYLIIYKKTHKTQWNSREGTANSSRDMYWAKVTQQLTLSRRYSQLVANRCCLRVCSLLETQFVTRDVFFFGKFVREPICSWWEAFVNRGSTVYIKYQVHYIQHVHWLKRGELKLLSLTDMFQIVAIYTDRRRISAAPSLLHINGTNSCNMIE